MEGSLFFVSTIFICLSGVCEGTYENDEVDDLYNYTYMMSCVANLECARGEYCCGDCDQRFCCNSSIYEVDFLDCYNQLQEEEESQKSDASKTLLIVVGSVAASLIFVLGCQGIIKKFCSMKYNQRRNGTNPGGNVDRIENGLSAISAEHFDNFPPAYEDLRSVKNIRRNVNPPNYYSVCGTTIPLEERPKTFSNTELYETTADPPTYSSTLSMSGPTASVSTISENIV